MTESYVLSLTERAASGPNFVGGKCFACGGEPTSGQGEHVIPKWMQRRFKLSDQFINLINGTRIPYRHLTIPCCEVCNNGFLRDIENEVIDFIDRPDFSKLGSRFALGRWLCKIFVGLLVKETSLLLDRADPSKGPIVSPEFLEEFWHAQLILQSARKKTLFNSLHGPYPFTLYQYKIEIDDDFGQFDLSTNIIGQSIAIRMGTVGIVFVNDGGLQYVAGRGGPLNLVGRRLHPIQFSEIAARVHYKATLRDATHAYTTVETPTEIIVDQVSVRPFSKILTAEGSMQIFRPWDDIECAQLIEHLRPIKGPPVYDPKSRLFTTTLSNGRGGIQSPKRFLGPKK
ncbi:hypothetical protein [Sandarakinorhabdus sp. AAP62]|uniref:hypothetical protein n=1 Tax=Sandarakinorhabdus sp. AAP62 TaxID=1248916 RepID=UPI00126742B7|nr:hypothetical protein [Sandarakinorhabdus sp. AAP62]